MTSMVEDDSDSSPPTADSNIDHDIDNAMETSEVVDVDFDVDTYSSRYPAHNEARLRRLLFVAKTTRSPAVSRRAYVLIERQMKECRNAVGYRTHFGPNEDGTYPATGVEFDRDWADRCDIENSSRERMLEARLSAAQTHLHREAIRLAYEELSEFFAVTGRPRTALSYAVCARDYASSSSSSSSSPSSPSSSDNNNNDAKLALLAFYADDWTKAAHFIQKLSPDKKSAASVLLPLKQGDFDQAAKAATYLLTEEFTSEELALEELCLYAGVCAAATSDRPAPKVDPHPLVARALRHLQQADYRAALETFDDLLPECRLDPYLAPHVDDLFLQIKERCMVLYLKPYSRVSLVTMGSVFGVNGEDIEDALEPLILDGRLANCKIDGETHILRRYTHQDSGCYQFMLREKLRRVGDRFVANAESMVLRASCLQHGLVVTSASSPHHNTRRHSSNTKDYVESMDKVEVEDYDMGMTMACDDDMDVDVDVDVDCVEPELR